VTTDPGGSQGGIPPAQAPALYPAGRLRAVAGAVRGKGIGALLLTPGPDLRYVTGYDAKQLERLTCLVIPA
jgi:Xaa-Pro aminopeptidase